ncbi:MAG: hypothetical protein QW797_08395 [Thermoproteota archaeon]
MQSSNKYSLLLLEANPFPLTPVPTRIWILGGNSRINALKRIREEIDYSFRLEEPKIDMLIGDAGSGKTHLALHLQYLLGQEKPGQPFSYIPTIQDSVYKPSLIFFTSKVVETLGGEEFLMELSLRLHQMLISRMGYELFQKTVSIGLLSTVLGKKAVKTREAFNRVLNDFRAVRELVEEGTIEITRLVSLELEELERMFETRFEPSKTRRFIDLNLAKWVLWFPSPYYGSWGAKHSNDYLRESDEAALKFLATLVNLSKLVSNSPFVIVVDEVETLVQDNVDVFFHTLKRIVDNGPGGLFILLLLTPVMFEELKGQRFRVAPAIVSRVSSTPISLEKISVEEAKDIIDKYVKALYLNKEDGSYSNMFPMNGVKLLWANSGGEIRRLLAECFTCIEILAERMARGITQPSFVDTVIVMEAIMKMGPPVARLVAPIEPDSDVKNQIITRFYNIEKPSERAMILEKAVSSLIETGIGKANLLGRRRIGVSFSRKREIDILFTDSTRGNISTGVMIKAPKPSEGLGKSGVEPLIDFAKSKKLDRLILLTTSPVDPELQKSLESFGNVGIRVLSDDDVSMLIYASRVFKNLSRPENPTPEVSLEILKRISLIG